MQITITGRNMELTQAIKEYATKRAGKIEEFFNQIIKVEVVLEVRHHDDPEKRHVAEFRAWLAGKKVLQATEGGRDIYAAIDLALSEIERQVKKHKEKHVQENRHLASKVKHDLKESLGA